ncbi:type I-C CRISPR-associated protein Cas5c [Persicirhabdus sediminis]|uniref:pre-crRNA processing endonuclease n=1 Tax=Persicirhabdus sediminis TaxID=454144 RepID=A0A8J7MGM1_9BACT|nr:type I-C CRISPR-associated protein Cas5c [Persicirhabdus sediminis]MBK1792481.1 type I-C CRISPR-associated protein Cas5 [Persicirhabdus sediminis]
MNSSIILEVSGDYALFSRPEMKVERVSYDVITPSAARGLLEAIYWKPQIRWLIDQITVINPIQFTNIRRNEISKKASAPKAALVNAGGSDSLGIYVDQDRQQRASLLLRDVRYLIHASIHIIDRRMDKGGEKLPANAAAGKHLAMFKRRASRGQAFHQPYFGCREFPASFQLHEDESSWPTPHQSLAGEKDLGFMLHDIEFEQNKKTKAVKSTTPHFFRAQMIDGNITVPPLPFKI